MILLFVNTQISEATSIAFFATCSAFISVPIKTFPAAKVLMDTNLKAEEVAKKSIQVASEICVFTNNNIKIEKI